MRNTGRGKIPLLMSLLIFFGIFVLKSCQAQGIYKDSSRKFDEGDFVDMLMDENEVLNRISFYGPQYAAMLLDEGYVKRNNINQFKNWMINKDAIGGTVDEDPSSIKGHMYIPRVTPKRQPGAILSWGLPANKVNRLVSPYRQPGMNRPAAAAK